MKKAYFTIIWIITAICIIGGTFYHVGGFITFFDKNYSGKKISANVVSDSQQLEISGKKVAIDVDGRVMELTLQRENDWSAAYDSEDYLKPQIKISRTDDGNEKITVTQPDAESKEVNYKRNVNCKLTMTVPKDVEISDFNVVLNIGDLNVSNISAENMDVNVDIGDANIENCKIRKGYIEAAMGDVDIEDSSFDEFEITADMGDIDIGSKGSLEKYMIDANVDVGSLSINGKNRHNEYYQDGKKGKLTVDASMGDVDIDW